MKPPASTGRIQPASTRRVYATAECGEYVKAQKDRKRVADLYRNQRNREAQAPKPQGDHYCIDCETYTDDVSPRDTDCKSCGRDRIVIL